MSARSLSPLRTCRGFSLLELLCTIAIMSMMGGAIALAVPGFRSTYERRAAVDNVMNTLEQARVAALQAGENVHVIFARPKDGASGSDAMIVVGDSPLGAATTGNIFYTKWIRLPKDVRFRGDADTLGIGTLPDGITAAALPQLPSLTGDMDYSGVTFNSTGQVTFPASGNLTMALYEGTRTGGGTDMAAGASAKATQGLSDSGLYEVIRIARYSGRARADVGTLQYK
jgi:prepilin-type N-terminal cleavage/methylation domain-containing protein